jgi:hypothetical protein
MMQNFKNYLIVAVLSIPFFTNAQNGRSFDFSFSPEACWRQLGPDANPEVRTRNKSETYGTGFRLGMFYNMQNRSQSAALRLGLLYGQSGYRIDDEKINTSRWKTLEMPVLLRIYSSDKQCISYLDFGGALHRRMEKNIPIEKRYYISANFGFGLVWKLQDNIAIFGQPNLRYYLTPNHAIGLKENRITGGIEFGVRRYLR